MKYFFYSLFSLLVATVQPCPADDGENYKQSAAGKDNTRIVSDLKSLRTALSEVKPGTRILITPGIYEGGFALHGAEGTRENPIIIEASDPELPPIFTSRGEAAKMSRVAYVQLKNIDIRGSGGNGINIDDGGSGTPSHHVILENLRISDIGAKKNIDAIKMSGVDHFIITNCRLQGWGGSGIDLVGCHQGVVQNCHFEGLPGFRTKNGMQIKGGSKEVLVQQCVFINAGERAVNIGGNTGEAYFRPQGAAYEAAHVIVAGNTFIGGEAHIAWVTSRQTHVHHNIFYLPEKFVGRILQETKNPRFLSSQKGLFEANLVVTDNRLRTYINTGANTMPDTFTFLANAWYRSDSDEKPGLPTPEIGGIYNVYPDLVHFGTASMAIGSNAPELQRIGPDAYNPWKRPDSFADIRIPDIKEVAPPARKQLFPVQPAILGGLLALGLLVLVIRRKRKRPGV